MGRSRKLSRRGLLSPFLRRKYDSVSGRKGVVCRGGERTTRESKDLKTASER